MPRVAAVATGLLYVLAALTGITWGLPTRAFDRYLFPDGDTWSGEKIRVLAQADQKFAAALGADVDPDAIERAGAEPLNLTKTEADIAKVYLRYRLYTFQPDEMITMMALAGMRPGELNFDPRLYQYGGLFIYPVGALIKVADLLGLIDVRGDVAYYLDHPDEFGKFYVVARLYSAAWGLMGVVVVFALTRRISAASRNERTNQDRHREGAGRQRDRGIEGSRDQGVRPEVPADNRQSTIADLAGALAALLFAVMPVVVCMSHEAKPHLPGAVLMLAAVYFGVRAVQSTIDNRRSTISSIVPSLGRLPKPFWLMCLCCGAALGTVLSAAPISMLIPLVAWQTRPSSSIALAAFARKTAGGAAVACLAYLLTNPYIVINLFINRDVLRSNFGNSLAMYEISRIGEGFVRVIHLTIEGATLPLLIFGALAFIIAVLQRHKPAIVLIVPALVFFLQFVLIGAGKPAEYGRFGIFTNAALAIGTACLLADAWNHRRSLARGLAIAAVVAWAGVHGAGYLRNFWLDTTEHGSRMVAAKALAEQAAGSDGRISIALLAEPAPYSCPPLNTAKADVVLVRSQPDFETLTGLQPRIFVDAVDTLADAPGFPMPNQPPKWLSWLSRETPISWANKPFVVSPMPSRPQ